MSHATRPEGQQREPIPLDGLARAPDHGHSSGTHDWLKPGAVDRRYRSATPDDATSGMAALSACIIAGAIVAACLVLAFTAWRQLDGRIARLETDLQALQTFTRCDAPPAVGDAMVITVRRTETRLVTRCQLITHPLAPERAGRTP
jgi:hypothetical protein